MTYDDLTSVSDDDLYALERQRATAPDWARIDAELRRRRTSRRIALADGLIPDPERPSLGDLERVALSLERQLDALDERTRRLRWWILFAPLAWATAGVAAWLALQAWAPAVARELVRLP